MIQSQEQTDETRARHDGEEPALIVARGLTKRFPKTALPLTRGRNKPGKLAVDDVSITVGAGEVFGLVGPNGAGKTTLIRMLSTLLVPSAGSARVAGYDVLTQDAQVRREVGVVASNERSFFWRLTGRQNLDFFASLYKLSDNERREWVPEMLDLLNLTSIMDTRFDRYSTGQKQRLAIARGLLSKPRVLLMDEPTKGVDPVEAARLIEVIQGRVVELWRPTILVTSHNLSEIQRLCKRIALLADGRLIAEGSHEELRALVSRAITFTLRVTSLDEKALGELARSSGALGDTRLNSSGGGVTLSVDYDEDANGLPKLIRAIVERGGDVLRCDTRQPSFEDVFQELVARHAPEAAKRSNG